MIHLTINDTRFSNVDQIKKWLIDSQDLNLVIPDKNKRKHWIQAVLFRFKYRDLARPDRGIIRKYIASSQAFLIVILAVSFRGTIREPC